MVLGQKLPLLSIICYIKHKPYNSNSKFLHQKNSSLECLISFWDFLKLAVLVFSSRGDLKVECSALFCAIECLPFNYLFYTKLDGGSQKYPSANCVVQAMKT